MAQESFDTDGRILERKTKRFFENQMPINYWLHHTALILEEKKYTIKIENLLVGRQVDF